MFLTNLQQRPDAQLLKIIKRGKFLGAGASRATYRLEKNTVIKLPAWLDTTKCQRFIHEKSLHKCASILELYDKYIDNEPDYYEYLNQSAHEAFLAQQMKSPILLPMLECGFFQCGLFYSIWPKADTKHGTEYVEHLFERLHYSSEQINEHYEELSYLEEEYDFIDDDCFDNGGNYGIYRGRIVCVDYGCASSMDSRD